MSNFVIRFWGSGLGQVLRWLLYIPIGLLLLWSVKLLSIVFFAWLFRDARGLVIIGLLFGGVALFIPAGGLYYLVGLMIMKTCPAPKVGMIIFGVLFYLFEIIGLVGSIIDLEWQESFIFATASIVCITIFSVILRISWDEPAEQFRQVNPA